MLHLTATLFLEFFGSFSLSVPVFAIVFKASLYFVNRNIKALQVVIKSANKTAIDALGSVEIALKFISDTGNMSPHFLTFLHYFLFNLVHFLDV